MSLPCRLTLADDEINNFSPGDMKVFGENLPEVEQFSEVVRDLHKRFVYFRPLQAPTDSETTRVSNRDAANSPGDSFEGVAERFSNMHGESNSRPPRGISSY